MPYLSSETKTYILRATVLFLAYVALGLICFEVIPSYGSVRIVWPPSAMALALLTLWGIDLIPALLLASFVFPLMVGVAPPLALGVALANTTEALVGAYLLRSTQNFNPLLGRLRDVLNLAFVAVGVSFVSSIIYAALSTTITQTDPSAQWGAWWVSRAVGMLSISPFVLRWVHYPHFSSMKVKWWVIVERILAFGSVAVLEYVLFFTTYTTLGYLPIVYLLVVPFIWVSLRTGPAGISLILAFTTAVTIGAISFGPIAAHLTEQTLLNVQIFIGALSIIFLPFTALVEERKEAVQKLNRQVDQLADALEKIQAEDKAKTEFLAVLAHELRNPLSPVLSGLEILKSGNDVNQQEVLRMMSAHTHTIARLLDDLLDFSRISQQKFKLQKERVSLHGVIDQTLEMVRPYISGRNHTLTIELPQEEIWLDADPVRMTQIFTNILNNSAKYTDPNGALEVKARRDKEEVVISIRDNGIGIAPDRIGKIFEPFAPGTPTRKPGGLRIGLSLAKRMAELHHGSIEVRSEGEGKGSEFIIRLQAEVTPQVRQPLASQVSSFGRRVRSRFTPQALKQTMPATGTRLLLVDDNEAAADSLATLLRRNGHEVEVVYDAPEALEKLTDSVFDTAILDIGLPTMDGYDLARLIKIKQPALRLIALTGYGLEGDKEKASKAGFVSHLVKPVSIVDVEKALAETHKN